MKKILSFLLVAVMLLGLLTACGGTTTNEGSSDLKIGFIFLHDENSTYDKNFLDAAEAATKELGLKPENVIMKTNVPEGNECYVAAKDLVAEGCKVVFANSFGHEDFMIQDRKSVV